MSTYEIFSDSLGDTTPQAAERFARFCTLVAEKSGYNIVFEINHKMAGYSPASIGGDISNICWDCDWYGRGLFKNSAINGAVSMVMALVSDE